HGGRLPASAGSPPAGMRLGGGTTGDKRGGSTRRSLELAAEKSLRSIAFPAIGTGIASFPLADCARLMLEEVVSHVQTGTSLQLVRFVLFSDEAEATFRREAERQLGQGSG